MTRRQPWLKAASTALYRSSSVMSLLMTVRIRHVPPSGANVSPVRRTFCISAAVPTVNASTRSDGRLTETRPPCSGSSTMSRTVPSMPEKSADDREVNATSSWPLHSSPRCTMSRTWVAGRSRTGRVIMPAWQKRQPRVQPRNTSTFRRSWTTSVSGTRGRRGIRPVGQVADRPLRHLGRNVGIDGPGRDQPPALV